MKLLDILTIWRKSASSLKFYIIMIIGNRNYMKYDNLVSFDCKIAKANCKATRHFLLYKASRRWKTKI